MPLAPTTKATLWMIGAILSFIAMTIAGRLVSFELDTFEIMLFRSLTGIFIVLVIGGVAGTLGQINRDRIGLHALRNMSHFAGQNLWFYALPLIPLAQLFALEFTVPIWIILFSPLLIGERITKVGALAAGLGFLGILMVARPDSSPLSLPILTAACSAIFFALSAIFTRKLTQTASITCIMFYLTTMQAVFGLVCAGFDFDITLPTLQTAPWVVMIGIAGLTAHFCLTTALSYAPASFVMPLDFTRLPAIAIIGMIFYAEPISIWVFIGAIVIFGANYMNIVYGQRR